MARYQPLVDLYRERGLSFLPEVKFGRPSLYKKSFCDDVYKWGATGHTNSEMAFKLGVTRDTLQKWRKKHSEFDEAMALGEQALHNFLLTLGRAFMTGTQPEGFVELDFKHASPQVWGQYAQKHMNFVEKKEHTHEGGFNLIVSEKESEEL